MHATLPLLEATDFPAIRRAQLDTLQVNMGYLCNQSCLHCHVNAGPKRKEQMSTGTVAQVVEFIDRSDISILDLTGGAPEMNENFQDLVAAARQRGIHVIDRCNLTILGEPGQETLADFLAEHQVEVVASLPCYLEENVESQRGEGVYRKSIEGLKKLNRLGYGRPDTGLVINLMYNPQGASLPPPQESLEQDYRRELKQREGIIFNHLYVLVNMPIMRFGSMLVTQGKFEEYMDLLKSSHQESNLANVMCRSLISVDWQGYLYDCDFNQMLAIPLTLNNRHRAHISELDAASLKGQPITIAEHCYGCTAGQGCSCSGAL
jgi:radical SAM/Cys-rich protein